MSDLQEKDVDLPLLDFSLEPFLLRLAYLLLSFPLGICYFVLLTAGISLGLGLAVIWVGIPILAAVVAAWIGLAGFERRLAVRMLGAEMAPSQAGSRSRMGFWAAMKFHLSDPSTWKGLVFLFLKFPLGIAGFSLLVSLAAASLALISVPFVYEIVPVRMGFSDVTTWEEALLCALAGLALAAGTGVLVNGLAVVWSRIASLLLSRRPPASDCPTQEKPLLIR